MSDVITIKLPSEYSKLNQSVKTQIGLIFSNELNSLANNLRSVSPVGATGTLKGSWRVIPVGFTASEFSFRIENTAENALYRLEGRPQGKQPPSDRLHAWVRKKLGVSDKELNRVAFLVARKIAREGTNRGKQSPKQFNPRTGDPVLGSLTDQTIKKLELKLNSLVI